MKAETLYKATGIEHDLSQTGEKISELNAFPQGKLVIQHCDGPELHQKVYAMVKADLVAKQKRLAKQLADL